MPEINLISVDQKHLARNRRQIRIAAAIAASLLAASLAAAAIISSLNWARQQQISRQESLIADSQQKIVGFSQTEQRQFLIYDRLDGSTRLLSSRPELKDRFDRLVAAFPETVAIETIKINNEHKSSQLAIRSDTFAGFFDTLKILRGGGFSVVDIGTVNRDKSGIYWLEIKITL